MMQKTEKKRLINTIRETRAKIAQNTKSITITNAGVGGTVNREDKVWIENVLERSKTKENAKVKSRQIKKYEQLLKGKHTAVLRPDGTMPKIIKNMRELLDMRL